MKKYWLTVLLLQGCGFPTTQLGCQTTASEPIIRTLNWKPTWQYADVDINQKGEFYFSPLDTQAGSVSPNVIYEVQLDGTRREIRLRNEDLEPSPLTDGNHASKYRSPGYLTVFGESVWVNGTTWLKGSEGVFQQHQLLRLQPHGWLPPELWRPAESEQATNARLLAVSETSLYAISSCGISRINAKPPAKELFKAEREGIQGDLPPKKWTPKNRGTLEQEGQNRWQSKSIPKNLSSKPWLWRTRSGELRRHAA